MAPAEGDRRLTSAMIATSGPSNADRHEGAGGASAAARSTDFWRDRSSGSALRVAARMPLRPTRVVACASVCVRVDSFGIFSGSAARGLMPLTKRQKQIVDYLGDYIQRNGFAPSF